MVTNEDRIEVATKLRSVDYTRLILLGIHLENHSMASLWTIGAAIGIDIRDENQVAKLFDRLADLIDPERTCKPVLEWTEDDPWPHLVCSVCGEPLRYSETSGEECDLLPYCARCGARVVENGL